MIPVHQTIFAGSPKSLVLGNCVQAVVASLLEKPLDEVPHFLDRRIDKRSWQSRLVEYLQTQGTMFSMRSIDGTRTLSEVLTETRSQYNRHIHYMLGGLSPRGVGHVVVVHNGAIVHDPHPDNTGLIGPNEISGMWRLANLVHTASYEEPKVDRLLRRAENPK